jgi:O-antigen/teichoic acid export membrane protein
MEKKEVENEAKRNDEISNEYRLLAKNSLYSGLHNFTLIIYSMVLSFLLARLITIETWQYFILANTIILIIIQLSRLIPPSLESSLNYYIPKYLILKQNSKLKSLIIKSFILRLSFLFLVFLVSILIFFVFNDFLKVAFNDNLSLLYLLSPLIIIDSVDLTLRSVNYGFNKFKINFFLYLTRIILNVSALIFCAIFVSNVMIELIAVISVLSYLIPFIINWFIVFKTIIGIKKTNEEVLSFKKVSHLTFTYGTPVVFSYFLSTFWGEFQKLGIGVYDTLSGEEKINLTGFNIANSYATISKAIMLSLNISLLNSFTRLTTKQYSENIPSFYNLLIKYSLFILTLISGFLFFLVDFNLVLIYGEKFLQFSLFLKLLLISVIFQILIVPFDTFISSQNKTKILAPIKAIVIIIQITFFFTLLFNFGVIGALIGMIIYEMLIFIFYSILTLKIAKIKLKMGNLILQYLIFFISIGICLFLENIILKELYINILTNLNLLILKDLPIFSLIIFFTTFISLYIILNIIKKEDLTYLELFFNKNTKVEKLIRRFLRFLKKITIY